MGKTAFDDQPDPVGLDEDDPEANDRLKTAAATLADATGALAASAASAASGTAAAVAALRLPSSEENLLRAVPLRSILAGCGHVLMAPTGSEKTFYLSKPSQHISLFLSHSWSTSGYAKSLGLMYFANIRRAFLASSAVAVLLFVLIATSDLGDHLQGPGNLYFAGRDEIRGVPTIVAGVIPILVFLILLVFGQYLPFSETGCFLDKCCIHQTDVVKKREGIKLLSRFLQISDRLMILYHPDYMTRLWCVYELAAFRHLKGNVDGSIQFLPLRVPSALMAMFLVHTFTGIMVQTLGPALLSKGYAEWVRRESPPDLMAWHYFALSFVAFFLGFGVVVRVVFFSFKKHIQEHRTLLRQLREFELSQTSCYLPEDRDFVEGQIVQWFGSVQEFEMEVRTSVADSVEKQVQTQVPMRWAPVASTALPHFFIMMMHGAMYLRSQEWDFAIVVSVFSATFTCCGCTIPIALMFRWLRFLGSTRCAQVAYAVFVHFSFVFFSALSLVLVSPAAPEWLVCVLVFVQVALTMWLFCFPVRESASHLQRLPPTSRGELSCCPANETSVQDAETGCRGSALQRAYEDDELSWN